MLKYRSALGISLVALSAAAAQPAAAQTAECYRMVIEDCAEALDGARWYEQVVIGIFCSALLYGCTQ